MADPKARIVISDTTGGRNGTDAPFDLAANEVVDAVNVDWWQTRVGRKRWGSASVSLDTGAGPLFTGNIASIMRFLPGTDESLAEIWAVDTAATPIIGRFVFSSGFAAPTLKDAPTGNGWDFHGVSAAGKFHLAYKSAQNRHHVWDTATVRRSGLYSGGVAATVANTGAGTYAATLRYYRIRFTIQSGGVTTFRSEPTPVVSFTPSGGGTAARITRPTAPGEGETHWEVEASADNVTFNCIAGDVPAGSAAQPAAIILATTTADDSLAPAVYTTYGIPAALGTYTLPKPYKYICGADNRIVGFGSYNASDNQHAVEWSAVNGSLNIGDLERVDTTLPYKYVFDEHDTGVPTGVIGPVDGNYYAFKSRAFLEMRPTGDVNKPFLFTVFKGIGAVGPKAISIGEDANGHPCVYFISHRGPYRYGLGGLVYLGHGIEDYFRGPTVFLNLEASKVIAHAVYHSEKAQWWVWHATTTRSKGSGDNQPTALSVYTARTTQGHAGGWARYTGPIATAFCSHLYADNLGALSATVSRDLKPYIGSSATANYALRCDSTILGSTTDDGTTFQAYLDLKPIEPGGPGFYGSVGDAILRAAATSGVTITATITRDFGLDSKTATALLTASGSETRVSVRLQDSGFTDCRTVSYRIGDGAAVGNSWTLDRLIVNGKRGEAEAA